MRFKLLLLLGIFFGSFSGQAQEYLQMIDAGTYKVQDVIESAETYFANRDKGRGTGYKPYKRWEYNALRLINEDGYLPTLANNVAELERWNAYVNETASNRAVLQDNWEDLGPTYWNATSGWNPGVGRITGMDIEKGNENHIIIGAETGGVWRTIDGAQTWSHLTDYFSHLSVYSVVIHPDNANTYFFGSSAGNIFKSTDSGATWSLLATIGNSIVNRILINPDNTNIMFAAAENVGLYRSVDGGQTWTKPISDNRGYDFEFKPGDLSVVYASGTAVHKSTDGGATFTTLGGGFTNGPKMMAVSAANPEVLYVLEASGSKFGALYSSTNSGTSFTKLNHGGLNFFGYSTSGNDGNGQAPRDMAIAVNPTNANEVHIAGILTWRSMNAGVNFTCTSDWVPGNATSQNIGYCHADVDDLLFYGTNLYAVTDGGIFRAANTGTINADYYEDLTTGLSIRQFYKIGISQTQDVIVSGGSQDNGTSFYTEAGGWKDWLGADGMETFIDKNNSNVFYGTSQFGSMYRSMNGGNTYFNINGPGGSGNWVTPFEQDPSVANTIYVAYKSVFKSINSGATWTPISQNFGNNLDNLKIAPSDNQVMYISRASFMYRTENGGTADWVQTANPGGRVNSIAIHPTNPNRVAVAVGGGKKVVITNDGGTTWMDYAKNLPNFSALAVVWDDNGEDGLYVGMDYGIYYTDNTFTDWQPYSNLLPNVQVNELEINKTTNMLYAATYGRGLWTSPVMGATAGVEDQALENQLSIYPNPATSEITIALPKSMNAEIRIFDITGKLLLYKANSLIDKNHTVDVSTLSSGIYFVRLNTPEGMAAKKLVIK